VKASAVQSIGSACGSGSIQHGHPDEIAAMVAYLAGPEAGFVTGADLLIDGGFAA
jgi:NAD(P)-dependent dehydrogenase (short-subunit alcohol dehydrogenase family)